MKTFSFIVIFLILVGFDRVPGVRNSSCLSTEEQKLYDIIMAYRKEHNLGTIPLSESLTYVAQTHAHDLSDNYTFDLNNKCNPHSWSRKGKWSSCCYTSDHKRAGCMWTKPKELTGYAGNGFEIVYYSSGGANAQEGLDGWKISPGHNPLLINTGTWANVEWKAIGIGIYKEYGMVWFGEEQDTVMPSRCE
ncbi:MAG TPA: CAP domain-containing protein [Chryseolinea sp.]|nr:CAP domain-containing protein [Chryseolinea sp.]